MLLALVALPAAVDGALILLCEKNLQRINNFHHTHWDDLISSGTALRLCWVCNEPKSQKNILSSAVIANLNLVQTGNTYKRNILEVTETQPLLRKQSRCEAHSSIYQCFRDGVGAMECKETHKDDVSKFGPDTLETTNSFMKMLKDHMLRHISIGGEKKKNKQKKEK